MDGGRCEGWVVMPEHVMNITVTATGRPYSDLLRDVKRDIVEQALAATAGDVARAARILGLAKSNLYRLMRDVGISSTRNQSDSATWNYQSDSGTSEDA